tara:strand:+ start:94 stop:744 length:651 start_codon:yes stop_codon:yes gene_type:complete
MANLKQYAYFLKGNKLAIVENDITPENDPTSRDYGPDARAIRYKSPTETVTNGLEIEYAYSPKYIINDLDDTKAITAYAESGGLLWFTVASMSATAGDWILIRGSDRWNGLHQVNATISGAVAVVVNTKYNGGAVTESSTLYQDIDILNDESDEIPIPDYLSKAVVYFVKAKMAEDKADFKSKEYFMKEFKQMVEKKQSANIWGPRVIVPGAGSIR